MKGGENGQLEEEERWSRMELERGERKGRRRERNGGHEGKERGGEEQRVETWRKQRRITKVEKYAEEEEKRVRKERQAI